MTNDEFARLRRKLVEAQIEKLKLFKIHKSRYTVDVAKSSPIEVNAMLQNRKFHIALIVIVLSAFLITITACGGKAPLESPEPTPDDTSSTQIDDNTSSESSEWSIPDDADKESGETKSATQDEKSESNLEKKLDTVKSSEQEKKKPVDTTTLHRVIVGFFNSKLNADNMAKALISDGFSPYVAEKKIDNKTVFLVQVGAFSSIKNYNERIKELEAKGYRIVSISGKPSSKPQHEADKESGDYRF